MRRSAAYTLVLSGVVLLLGGGAAAMGQQDEIDGVFPQLGTGQQELEDAAVVKGLEAALKDADKDGDGVLPWSEAAQVFPRIRAKGDFVWTPMHEKKFGMVFGDRSVGDGTATTATKLFSVLKGSNLEIDWRLPAPPPPLPQTDKSKRAGYCVMETCSG
jgi:hypothetical protein